MSLIGNKHSPRGRARALAWVAVASIVAVGGLVGCPSSPPPPGGCPAGCPQGFTCVNNSCQTACPGGCPTGETCQSGQCVSQTGCNPACAADYACNGSRCVLDAGIGQSTCLVAPVIQASLTVAGPAIAPTSCVTPIGASALSGQVVSHGQQHTGDVVPFNVPPSTASFSIVSQLVGDAGTTIDFSGQTLGNVVVPLIVNGPSGQLYNDAAQPPADLSSAPIAYASYSPAMGMMTVPNTSAMLNLSGSGLPSGSWSFTVGDYATECLTTPGCDGGFSSSVYDVTVILKPGAPAATGAVDVAFYLVDTAGGLTAAAAVSNPSVIRMVQTLGRLYAQSGICIGTVTFYDVQPWAQAKFSTSIDADKIEPCDNLNQMFTLSMPGTNAINFFLVQQITSSSQSGGQVEGIDGTIPGPSSYGGIIHSGAAVSAANLLLGLSNCQSNVNLNNCGPDITAYIAAHEGGHWMGLYHTTEGQGTLFDTLSDTATCECKSCVSDASQCADATNPPAQPVFVNTSSCVAGNNVCGGGENLMFWLLDPQRSIGLLSPQQGQMIRANPIIH